MTGGALGSDVARAQSGSLPARAEDAIVAERLLAALGALGTALLAVIWSGSVHPDEVYQFLEPANRLAFGFGIVPWEWEVGLRNWLMPALLAAGMKGVDLLGGTSALGHRLGAAAVLALCAYPGLAAVQAYARRRTSSCIAARLALALVLAGATSLYFLGRSLGEPIGALASMAALGALDADDRPWRRGAVAGLWLGFAVVVRYGFASLVPIVLLSLVFERRFRALGGAVASGAAVALALGVLDWVTWGAPFHSLIEYMRFNLGAGAARRFGAQPAWFYLRVLRDWAPWPLLLGLPWFSLRSDRLLLPAGGYLVALSLASHKEDRCLFPVIFLLAVALGTAAAEGLVSTWRRGGARRLAAIGAVAALLLWSTWTQTQLMDVRRDLFLAMMRVGADPGLSGLAVFNQSVWSTGGKVYVGRDVPLHHLARPRGKRIVRAERQVLADPSVNRILLYQSPDDLPMLERAGFRQVDRIGDTTILAR